MSAAGLSMQPAGRPTWAPGMRRGSIKGLSRSGFHRMAYVAWGRPNDMPPVVCVHGLTRNGRDFDRLAQALAPDRYVICPDVVGRGQSDWLKDPAGYALPQYCADLTALIAHLGAEQVDWLGTSMGGLIGMTLAAQPGTPIRRLVLNDVGPFIPRQALERIGGLCRQGPALCGSGEPRGLSAPDPCAGRSNGRRCLASFRRLRPSPPAGRQLWPRL